MKKRLGLTSLGKVGGWTGGVYYIRNMAYQLSCNKEILENYDIFVFIRNSHFVEFKDLPSEVKLIQVSEKFANNKLICMLLYVLNRIDILFPMGKDLSKLNIQSIAWIPDFQHVYFPELFEKEECQQRTDLYTKFAKSNRKIVLSSNSAFDNFKSLCEIINSKVEVVRFVSYIEPIIRDRLGCEEEVLNKFGLKNEKYVCVMNQFWQHKNHIVVLEAMRVYFANNPESDLLFVFTGKLEDYRNPEHIRKIVNYFEKEEIRNHSIRLGFLDRKDQIIIMKNSMFVIQPSLFEGWGTVVEDAKVLDKTILLSDILVHREQMNSKCILFNPYDCNELANLIEKESLVEHSDDIENGIKDMHNRALEYSKSFEKLLLEG